MKKGIISLLLCLLMVMMLFAGCAQGNKTEETEAPTEAPTQAAAPVDLYTLALGCVGSPVSTLYATVGYPNYSTYGQSCMGEGEDGQLFYDGFEVNTFRSDTVPEYVTAVWPD